MKLKTISPLKIFFETDSSAKPQMSERTSTLKAFTKTKICQTPQRRVQETEVDNGLKGYPKLKTFHKPRRPGRELQTDTKNNPVPCIVRLKQTRRPRAAKKRPAISLVEGGTMTLELGEQKVSLRRMVHQKSSAAYLSKGIPMVDPSQGYFDTAKKEAEGYQEFEGGTAIVSEDNLPLVVLLKRAMFAGLSDERAESSTRQSLKAIIDLTLAYPPKPPRDDDPRHKVLRAEEKQRCEAEALQRGLYAS